MPAIKDLIQVGRAEDYLRCTDIVDFDSPAVAAVAASVAGASGADTLRAAFELVRDRFPHTLRSCSGGVACSASDVLRMGHGLCYAKSHLLAALLRHHRIPAGFCYQRFIEDDGPILHGLVAAFVDGRWVRLDPREGTAFDPGGDMLAFRTDESRGERDYLFVFPRPDAGVVRVLRSAKDAGSLAKMLPQDLSCPS
jgi:transglutaminase-like putative cysteine protease